MSEGGPILRRLGARDLDRVATLHDEAFAPWGERVWTRQDVAELFASPGVDGLLLEVAGRDVGMAVCRVVVPEAELLTIAVRRGERRQGLGRRLLRAVIDHVRGRGARTLFLEVGVDNPTARALYDSEGFRPVGTRPAYYSRGAAPPADAVVMSLDLG